MKIDKEKIAGFFNTTRWIDSALLFLRIFAGGMLLWHGIMKIQNYNFISQTFPSVFGMGSQLSLMLTILVEVVASAMIICGALTRLALIPAAFTMFVAAFAGPESPKFGELAFMYLGIFVALFIAGPGMYSLDRLMVSRPDGYGFCRPKNRKTK